MVTPFCIYQVKSTPRTPLVSNDQSTITSLICTPKKYSMHDQWQSHLTNALVTFIAGDLLPLSIVESP